MLGPHFKICGSHPSNRPSAPLLPTVDECRDAQLLGQGPAEPWERPAAASPETPLHHGQLCCRGGSGVGRSWQSWLRRSNDFSSLHLRSTSHNGYPYCWGDVKNLWVPLHTLFLLTTPTQPSPHGDSQSPSCGTSGAQAHLQSSEATTTFEKCSSLLRKVCPLLVCAHFRQKKTKLLFPCGDLGMIPKAWQTQFLEGWTSTWHSDLSKNGQMGVRAEECLWGQSPPWFQRHHWDLVLHPWPSLERIPFLLPVVKDVTLDLYPPPTQPIHLMTLLQNTYKFNQCNTWRQAHCLWPPEVRCRWRVFNLEVLKGGRKSRG